VDRLAAQTDTAFRGALSGDFSGLDDIDALIAAEKARTTPYDRMHSLLAHHRVAGMVQADILAQSSKYVTGAYRADTLRRYEAHRVAVKCLRRRIDRMATRGAL